MSTITTVLFGSMMFNTLAPVPLEPPPDPMARGYMGITIGSALTIERIEPRMPAEKAGLRAGDSIVRVGSLHPQSFDEVVAHICSFRPGAVVEIEVRRGSELKTFKVKLGCRPPELDAPIPEPPPPQP